jgi:hypothetical protein
MAIINMHQIAVVLSISVSTSYAHMCLVYLCAALIVIGIRHGDGRDVSYMFVIVSRVNSNIDPFSG